MKNDPYAALRSSMSGPPSHWRSIEQKDGHESVVGSYDTEFPSGLGGFSRRDAMKLSGASIALGMLSACKLRRPEDGILPYVKQPENVIPGLRMFYATAMQRSSGAIGLVVEAHEGRPTKIEGNAKHPSSLGASDTWAQAEILKLYDPDRARAPMKSGQPSTWAAWDAEAQTLAQGCSTSAGKGFAVLAETLTGPTSERLLAGLVAKYPEAKVYRFDRLAPAEEIAGVELAFGPGARAHVELEKASTIFALDSDFLFNGPDALKHTRALGRSRAVHTAEDLPKMKRLYVAEGAFSGTGTNADHRLRWASGQGIELLEALAAAISEKGAALAPELAARVGGKKVSDEAAAKFVEALAKDLVAHKGAAIVMVGENQPAAVHALGHALNVALGALESGVLTLTSGPSMAAPGIDALAADLSGGKIDTLLVLDGNPHYAAPGGVGLDLSKAKTVIHTGVLPEETGAKASWHLPSAHFLEAWGDAQAWDGTASIVQPLILPLHGARASISILAQLIGDDVVEDKRLVEATWRLPGAPLEGMLSWRRALHEGVIEGRRAPLATPALNGAAVVEALAKVQSKAPTQDALELVATLGHAKDGRLSNVSWVMELPDSLSKLCWDNAVLMAPSLAKALGISSRVDRNKYVSDVVELTADGRKITAPTFVMPGLAPFTLTLNDGYGRTAGEVAKGVGAAVSPLLAAGHVVSGVSLRKTGATAELCSTQDHFAVPGNPLKELTFAQMSAATGNERKLGLINRPLFRSGSAAEFAKGFDEVAEKGNIPHNLLEKEQPPKNRPSRPIQPVDDIHYEGQQWGMVIDLSACTGCNACAIACVAENNIPVVGREQVMLGREMHWLRIDRYFMGDVDQPMAAHQPVACQMCENAPCEPVCPVGATSHDEEGMNSMAYNRCIGTRYCANNCPYKVRRFNYLDFTHTGNVYVPANEKERMRTLKLQRNPDVTVRYRGIMEKCTYCTQRVEEAKKVAKRAGEDRKKLPDGAITPACAQACPAEAITFGNINDESSRVAKLKKSGRNYEMLQELNVRPRTTYLARVKNENEELA